MPYRTYGNNPYGGAPWGEGDPYDWENPYARYGQQNPPGVKSGGTEPTTTANKDGEAGGGSGWGGLSWGQWAQIAAGLYGQYQNSRPGEWRQAPEDPAQAALRAQILRYMQPGGSPTRAMFGNMLAPRVEQLGQNAPAGMEPPKYDLSAILGGIDRGGPTTNGARPGSPVARDVGSGSRPNPNVRNDIGGTGDHFPTEARLPNQWGGQNVITPGNRPGMTNDPSMWGGRNVGDPARPGSSVGGGLPGNVTYGDISSISDVFARFGPAAARAVAGILTANPGMAIQAAVELWRAGRGGSSGGDGSGFIPGSISGQGSGGNP